MMNKERIARELVAVARELTAKPEIDFQAIAKQLDDMIDEIDSHMNVYQRDYDRPVASRIHKATMQLISAKKAFEETEAYDEDPFN